MLRRERDRNALCGGERATRACREDHRISRACPRVPRGGGAVPYVAPCTVGWRGAARARGHGPRGAESRGNSLEFGVRPSCLAQRVPLCYRIAKKRHPIYDPGGAVAAGTRWTSPGYGVIYAAEHYATGILEILVHYGRVRLPGPHHARAIYLPDDLRIERFDPAAHAGWHLEGSPVAREFGDGWFTAGRTAVLAVPSVPGQPAEWNYIINPGHPEAGRIQPLPPFDVVWDGRLFGPPPGTVSLDPARPKVVLLQHQCRLLPGDGPARRGGTGRRGRRPVPGTRLRRRVRPRRS